MSDLIKPAVWPPKWQPERICAEFDFAPDMRAGDSIADNGIQFVITCVEGEDQAAAGIAYGAPQRRGARVLQLLDGGVADCAYLVQCRVTTEQGQVLVLAGVLRVKALVAT